MEIKDKISPTPTMHQWIDYVLSGISLLIELVRFKALL